MVNMRLIIVLISVLVFVANYLYAQEEIIELINLDANIRYSDDIETCLKWWAAKFLISQVDYNIKDNLWSIENQLINFLDYFCMNEGTKDFIRPSDLEKINQSPRTSNINILDIQKMINRNISSNKDQFYFAKALIDSQYSKKIDGKFNQNILVDLITDILDKKYKWFLTLNEIDELSILSKKIDKIINSDSSKNGSPKAVLSEIKRTIDTIIIHRIWKQKNTSYIEIVSNRFSQNAYHQFRFKNITIELSARNFWWNKQWEFYFPTDWDLYNKYFTSLEEEYFQNLLKALDQISKYLIDNKVELHYIWFPLQNCLGDPRSDINRETEILMNQYFTALNSWYISKSWDWINHIWDTDGDTSVGIKLPIFQLPSILCYQ